MAATVMALSGKIPSAERLIGRGGNASVFVAARLVRGIYSLCYAAREGQLPMAYWRV